MIGKSCFLNEDRERTKECVAFGAVSERDSACKILQLADLMVLGFTDLLHKLSAPTNKTVFPKSAPPPEVR